MRACVRCLFSFLTVLFCLIAAAPVLRAQTLTEDVLHNFGGANDGRQPIDAPIQASDGNFYGVTASGGKTNSGTLYRLTPDGTETVLYNFCSQPNCTDGAEPYRIIEATDGNLYGVTLSGGASMYYGTIFRVNLSGGGYTVLYSGSTNPPFYGDPVSITEATDGNFYGGLASGSYKGGVYKLTPAGVYSVLYGDNSGDFEGYSDIVQAADGNLYGISVVGGFNSGGNIYRLSLAGGYADVYDFCSVKNCADGNAGGVASGNLVQGADTALYATTVLGGVPMDTSTFGEGVFFRFDPATGGQSVLYTFCSVDANCSDGARPYGSIFLGGDGLFYGNNSGTPYVSTGVNKGNLYSQGAAVKTHTILYDYLASENTNVGPSEGAEGNLYDPIETGGTETGGEAAEFATQATPPIQISITPASITGGQSATLTWTVNNAFSKTMQRCFASGGWSGLKATSGSISLSPAASTTYSLTCGGIESGITAITVVVPQDATKTVLTAAPNPAALGATIKLTATVTRTSASGVPTGTVSFLYNGATLTTATLNANGVATFSAPTTGYPVGNYPITARYNGDASDLASTSVAVNLGLRNATTTALSASPNPVTPPASVMLTATVSRSKTTGTPGGTVSFLFQGSVIAKATLKSGGVGSVAASTTGLPAGSYPITAKYSGSAMDLTSTSPAVVVVIK